MAQHFLLSAKARTLSVVEVARLSEEDAYARFKAIRFSANDGEPFCPHCGCDAVYTYKVRREFKCKACEKRFTVTSGTSFHGRKMSCRDILTAMAMFINGVNGNAALRLSRDLGCAYKTALVLSKKLSRAMGSMQRENVLTGDVDVDGIFIGGYVRPENMIADRRSDGRKEYNAKRRVIVTMRERRPGGRSRAIVVPSEKAAVPTVYATVNPNAHVTTDEGSAFSRFHIRFAKHSTVNHSVGMMVDGIHNNPLESQHMRIRRGERGVYMRINGAHAQRFADELSWRDDFRRLDNGQQFMMLATRAITLRRDLEFQGYWQKQPKWLQERNRRIALQALTRRRRGLPAAPISYAGRAKA